MNRYHSYLRSAATILANYTGAEPLAVFLKKYFAQHKKFGSSDRKQVGHLCYCYFRMGKALPVMPPEERILSALFLCSDKPQPLLAELAPALNDKLPLPMEEKLALPGVKDNELFPWQDELSEGIAFHSFARSFFTQPDMFLRVRPGRQETVLQKLNEAGVEYNVMGSSCIALPNNTKADALLWLNKEAVVQDLSSQRVSQLLELLPGNKKRWKLWDCCAASGGKSILAADILGDIELTVSDIRQSMLTNLAKRFAEAGINRYKSFTADLTGTAQLPAEEYDLVIADVPCSGSGTWGRTPEQLYYYDADKTPVFAALQQKIVSNILTRIKPGGYLLYITCSVFKKENEDMIVYLTGKKLEAKKVVLLKGYEEKADTMFAALLQKPL